MVLAQSSSSFVTNSTTNNNGNHYRNSSRNSTSPPASLSMTTVDSVNGLLTVTKWAIENDVFLSDFVERYALPHLVVVTKGNGNSGNSYNLPIRNFAICFQTSKYNFPSIFSQNRFDTKKSLWNVSRQTTSGSGFRCGSSNFSVPG